MSYTFCQGEKLCGLCRSRHPDGVRFRANRGGDFECPLGKPWTDERWLPPKIAAAVAAQAKAAPQRVMLPEDAERSRKRFEICKACDQAENEGFKCALHKGCCFGRWRSKPESKCPQDKW